MDLTQIKSAFQEAASELKGLIETQTAEIRKHGETTEKTANALAAAEKRIEEISEELKAAQTRMDELEAKGNRLGVGADDNQSKSFGEIFVESEAYKNMIARGASTSDPVDVGSFRKSLSSDPASAGVLVVPHRVPGIIGPAERAPRIRDLLPTSPTNSNAIEYVQEKLFTNAAAPQKEGDPKAQSNLTFELKTESVKTLAHWIPATRQILADASQLQGYVNGRLLYGLEIVEEQQILYGDGTGQNLQGLMTNPLAQEYAWSDGKPGDTKIDAIRRAITKARLAEYPVTGIVLHPSDWEDIELAKGSDGHYIWVSVTEGGATRLWRVPVVDTTAMQEGDFLVGAFGLGAMIWDREQASIRVAEQHNDYFTRNMVAILAEERIALTTFRPQAFVRGEFDEPPADTEG